MADFMPVQIASVILGLFVVAFTLTSAIRSFVLPRGDNVPLTRWIFVGVNVVLASVAAKLAPMKNAIV